LADSSPETWDFRTKEDDWMNVRGEKPNPEVEAMTLLDVYPRYFIENFLYIRTLSIYIVSLPFLGKVR